MRTEAEDLTGFIASIENSWFRFVLLLLFQFREARFSFFFGGKFLFSGYTREWCCSSECESASEPLQKTPAPLLLLKRKPFLTKRSGPQRHRHYLKRPPTNPHRHTSSSSPPTPILYIDEERKQNGRFSQQQFRRISTRRTDGSDRSSDGDDSLRIGVAIRPQQ